MVAVFSSNYTLYGDLSQRVMQTLEQFSPEVEIYSIDEAFLNLTGFTDLRGDLADAHPCDHPANGRAFFGERGDCANERRWQSSQTTRRRRRPEYNGVCILPNARRPFGSRSSPPPAVGDAIVGVSAVNTPSCCTAASESIPALKFCATAGYLRLRKTPSCPSSGLEDRPAELRGQPLHSFGARSRPEKRHHRFAAASASASRNTTSWARRLALPSLCKPGEKLRRQGLQAEGTCWCSCTHSPFTKDAW